jgi:hypothetical protein
VRALRCVPLLSLALGAGAAAAPKPRPLAAPKPAAAPKPLVDEACAPKDADAPLLVAAGGKAVACWRQDGAPDACFELARDAAPRRLPDPAAAPAEEPPAASVRDDGAGPAACAGAVCKPLGATIRAALAKARALGEGGYTTPQVTSDLRLLVVENQLFSIADDRRVRPRPPPDLAPAPAPPRLAGVELAGDLAIASWATCAGPCLVSAAVDARGASRSASFPGGAPVGLDGRRVAILPREARATVTVLDRATGQPLGAVEIHDGTSRGMLGIGADAQTLVALAASREPAGWDIVWLTAPPGAPPSALARQAIASCP